MENSECRMQNPKMQKHNDLKDRKRSFALAVITFCEHLPKDETSKILGRQLLRAASSRVLSRCELPGSMPREIKSRLYIQDGHRARGGGRDWILDRAPI